MNFFNSNLLHHFFSMSTIITTIIIITNVIYIEDCPQRIPLHTQTTTLPHKVN